MRTAILVSAVVLLPVALLACGHHRHRSSQHGLSAEAAAHKLEILMDYLDATDAQRLAIEKKASTLVAQAGTFHGRHQQAKGKLLGEWNKSRPDAAALHALVDSELAQVKKLAHQLVDTMVEVHQELTPEQRAKVAKLARHGH